MDSLLAKTDERRTAGRPIGRRPDPDRIARIRAALCAAGKTVRSWADENGETPAQVYKVLNGERACVSGEAHRIAVKLGIKDGAATAANDEPVPSMVAPSTTRRAGGANPARRESADTFVGAR